MTTLRMRQTVTQDHQLHLVLPAEFPAGDVEVTVRSMATTAVQANEETTSEDRVEQGRRELEALFAMIDALPPSSKRSAQEIDRSIYEERASWD